MAYNRISNNIQCNGDFEYADKLSTPEFCPGKLCLAEIFLDNLKSQLSSF